MPEQPMSPLDLMIDAACGVPPGWKPQMLLLRCPACRREKQVRHELHDPASATVLEAHCPECQGKGHMPLPVYQNVSGEVLEPPEGPDEAADRLAEKEDAS